MPRAGWEPAGAGSTGSTGSRVGRGLVRPLRAPRRGLHPPAPFSQPRRDPPRGGRQPRGDTGVPSRGSGCALGVASPARREGTKPPLRHRWWEEEEEGGGAEREAGGRELCRNAACAAFPWLGAAEGFHGKRRRGSMNISLGKQCGVLQRTSGWSPWRPLPCAGSRNCEIRRKTRERGSWGDHPVTRGAFLPSWPSPSSAGRARGFVLWGMTGAGKAVVVPSMWRILLQTFWGPGCSSHCV